jgi:hypothetical protein
MHFTTLIRLSWVLVLAILMSIPISASAQECPIDLALAEQYFQEAKQICRKDNGQLWGVSLCGPLMFVDRCSRMIVANQSDAQGNLVKKGNVFLGTLPEKETIANTATRWAGVKWTMVVWPLPANKQARAKLMMHELYHRIQNDIGLPASNPANNHLDTREGRLWLQLEWRALRRAATTDGAESRQAIEDALIFRLYRRSLFPNSDATERGLEMNEGLAEYTGVKLRGSPDKESVTFLARQLETAESNRTFVRSFAYISGPAYGFLLDRSNSGSGWRKGLKPSDDFGLLAQRLYSIKLPADLKAEAERRSPGYGGDSLSASETERDNERRKRVAEHRARFIDGPIVVFPLTDNASYGFDPNNVESLDDLGTVYPTLRVSDAWGILEVTRGALMLLEGSRVSRVQVPAPADPSKRKVQGDGWTLDLGEGWHLVPGTRKGDYSVKKTE